VIPAIAAAVLATPQGRKATAVAAGLIIAVPLALAGGLAQTSSTDAGIANTCLTPGQVDPAVLTGGRPAWWDTGGLGAQRNATAGLIVAVAAKLGLPPRASTIAIATAIQESKLLNLPGGDRDSAGIFQQRPGAEWGTHAQITDPTHAANAFFRALMAIPNWRLLPLTVAAQKVQRSAFPDGYAQWEPLATQLVLGAQTARTPAPTSPTSVPSGVPTTAAAPSNAAVVLANDPANAGCAAGVAAGIPTNPGSPFHDGPAFAALPRANPRSAQQAIAWAALQQQSGTTGWYSRCLAFVALTYGWNVSGISYALDAYTGAEPQYRHPGDRNPPPGALLFWDTGQRAGHVALYLGGGMIATTDYPSQGQVGVVAAEAIEQHWGARYVGWTPPYFPHGG